MEQRKEYIINGEPVISPEVPIIIGDKDVILSWHNTLIRHFGVGDGENDFAVYIPNDEEFIAFRVDEEMKRRLDDLRFPFSWDPILDEDAQDCLIACIMAESEQEFLSEN